MFCPKCGQQSGDEQKFCKGCGTNLMGVGLALKDPESQRAEREWRRLQSRGVDINAVDLDALTGWRHLHPHWRPDTPKERSDKMMQGGIITAFAGLGITIFLYFLFTGIARAATGPDAAVLEVIWAAGLIPFFVGIGLLLSGWLFRPKGDTATQTRPLAPAQPQKALPEANLEGALGSVTENTTRQLYEEPVRPAAPAPRTGEVAR